jgi:hypothetical protein
LSRDLRCTEEYKTVGRSVRRYSIRWASSRCVDRHMRKGPFEFCRLRKNPRRRTFHRVAEHPESLSKRLLEGRIARRASRVKWAVIYGKLIQLLEFSFDFFSEVLLYFPSGMSKFDFGPKFLQEIL